MAGNVLIIGGGSGIGKQVLHDLVNEGYNVWTASSSISESDVPDGVKVQQYDVTSDAELEVPDELHGLVYCPGTINLKPFKMLSVDHVRKNLEVNYVGAVKVLQQSIDALKKGNGSAVFFSTVAVQTGMPFHSSVSAVKGAIEGMVRSLAAEYAPKVRFNAVAPSLTQTPLAEHLINNDKKRESNTDRHPMKMLGEPQDIANMVNYLLSDKARWITGQVMKVDGGMSSIRPL